MSTNTAQIKFNAHHVTDGTLKVSCWYSIHEVKGRPAVTIYQNDYSRTLSHLFPDQYRNDTDSQTDYFEKGRAILFEDHPLYAAALKRAQANNAAHKEKIELLQKFATGAYYQVHRRKPRGSGAWAFQVSATYAARSQDLSGETFMFTGSLAEAKRRAAAHFPEARHIAILP